MKSWSFWLLLVLASAPAMGQSWLTNPFRHSADNSLPSVMQTDPNIDYSIDFCQGLQQQEFIIDGQKVMRYPMPELKYLRCLKAGQPTAPWLIKKAKWEDQDDQEWQNFIHNLGLEIEQGFCTTVDGCMISKGNVYRNDDDVKAMHYADCAKFPMYLRLYFAYKKNLPFSFVYEVKANPLTPDQITEVASRRLKAEAEGPDALTKFDARQEDIRYTRNGNYPVSRINIPQKSGNVERDFFKMSNVMMDGISTASYRMFQPGSETLPDFYSPAISTEAIKPGTVLYTAAGHVALVYDIRPNGVIMTLNAAPGNTVSVQPFSAEFERSIPNHGAGFKNFRPFEITDPIIGTGQHIGEVIGGPLVFRDDNQIPDFSPEQYYGNQPDPSGDWRQGKFIFNNQEVSWVDFVKLRLANGVYKQNPLFDFRRDLTEVCKALQDRVPYVATAMNPHAGGPVAQQPHPHNLPDNVFGADGDWESFSSPGRDLRTRTEVLTIIQNLHDYKTKLANGDSYFDYRGRNLKYDLLKIFFEVDQGCQISYPNSAGAIVTIPSLSLALARLPRISYDPYDCPELRWGANQAAELRTCSEDQEKVDWYRYQQFIRNYVLRDSDDLMGWDLNTLESKSTTQDNSVNSEKFNILSALEAL